MTELVYREDFVREAQRMRAEGLLIREIAEHFDRAPQTVSAWLTDPDLSKQRARHKRYQGVCEDCGDPTTGCNGRAKAPKVCESCTRKRREAKHGTRSRYARGCSCDECRRANREHKASLKGAPPPRHGNSGYVNYGCRCDVCKEANLVYQRRVNPEYRRRWLERVRGTEPPRHGYSTAYLAYGCRCEECRAWAREHWRRRRRQKRAA